MANDDGARSGGLVEPDGVTESPRRSTFVPPGSTAASEIVSEPERYDDDALAAMLAVENQRLGFTGTIRTVPEIPSTVSPAAPLSLADFAAPSGPPVVFARPDIAPPVAPSTDALPTRRSIRDAEQARLRREREQRTADRSPEKPQERESPEPQESETAKPVLYDLVEPVGTSAPAPAASPVFSEPIVSPQVEEDASLERAVVEDAVIGDASGGDAAGVDVVAEDASEAHGPTVFAVELSGAEPTPVEDRVGRSVRLFWLWFAANSSVLSVAFGGALFSLGMSLRQAVVAAFVGVAISFLPLGLGTLAGKWSGQPIMIVSRAAFGLVGNLVPAALALLTRLIWGAVLLWLIAVSTARILVGAGLNGPLGEPQITIVAMGAGFVIALVVAFFGYSLFARIQLILGILSAGLVAALIVITWPAVDFARALTVADGPFILVVTGVVLVFSFVGLVWANSSGDLARYQRPSGSGGAAMVFASFGTTLPAFVLIAYGSVLAASNPSTAAGLARTPLDTIAGMLPGWAPIPLVAATVLSLLSGVILSIYSGAFALRSVGLGTPRAWSTVIVGALVFLVAIALSATVSDVVPVFRDLATTLAVPVAAWAGIFAAEMIIRRRRFDSESLLRRGGVYPDVNWVNLSMLVAATILGLGFTTATLAGLGWEGYLFRAFGVSLSSDLAGTDLGVLGALALGLLTPLVAGVRTIRRQERPAS